MSYEENIRETPDIETSSAGYASRFAGRAGDYMLRVQNDSVAKVLGDQLSGASVLDVGGGHGQLWGLLMQRNMKLTVIGSDSSCYDRVRQGSGPRPRMVVGDLLTMPFPDQSFDYVVSVRLISHVQAWPQLITEFCRVAQRAVVIDYPSLRSLNALTPLLFSLKRGLEGNTRTYTSFHGKELTREFATNGFVVVRQERQFFLPMVLHRALKGSRITCDLETGFNTLGMTQILGSPVILRADRKARAVP